MCIWQSRVFEQYSVGSIAMMMYTSFYLAFSLSLSISIYPSAPTHKKAKYIDMEHLYNQLAVARLQAVLRRLHYNDDVNIYLYISIPPYIYPYIYLYIRQMDQYQKTYIYIYIYICMYVCMYVYIYTYILHIYVYIYIFIYIYIYKYTHIYGSRSSAGSAPSNSSR